MPVIRSGSGEDVDLAAVEHLTHVGIAFDADPLLLTRLHDASFEDAFVDVADGGDAHTVHIFVGAKGAFAAAVDSNDTDADVVVGSKNSGFRQCEGGTEADGADSKFAAGVGRGRRSFHGSRVGGFRWILKEKFLFLERPKWPGPFRGTMVSSGKSRLFLA